MRYTLPETMLVFSLLGALTSACKQPAHETVAPAARPSASETTAPAPAAKAPATTVRSGPTEADFIQPDDAPRDPAAELEAARHNCCDEMPPDEVKAHSTSKDPP